MINLYENFILFFVLTFLIVFTHEIGHAIKLSKLTGRKIKIWYHNFKFYAGYDDDYKDLTNIQLVSVYYTGILYGLILTSLAIFILDQPFNTALLVFYVLGCTSDLKKMYKYGKKHKKKRKVKYYSFNFDIFK